MDCDVCLRAFTARRRALCVACLHAILYAPRIQQAAALLDREKHHAHAEAVTRPGNDGVIAALPEDADFDAISKGVKKHSLDRSRAEQEAIELRINDIADKAQGLRKEMEQYQHYATSQREAIERRRKNLSLLKTERERNVLRALEPVHLTTKKAAQRLDKTRSRIVDARSLLCREAAIAMNFVRRKGANGRSEYILGCIVIPDLRELNARTQPRAKAPLVGGRTIAEPHELISEAFDNVCRILNLCAHYLSVRLPGELLLPREDFPRAAIMPEKSSYKYNHINFPGLSPSQATSPTTSRVMERDQPRPRPLWLDRPLGQLAKEDPKAYGLYIEGVTMLAYNVAWLCRTQGFGDISTFDDICAIGRNLYQLLTTQHRRSQPRRTLDRKTGGTASKLTALPGKDNAVKQEFGLGEFSHNSAQHNLASAAGLDLIKAWNPATSHRLSDRLRNHLLTEISGAEWDLLEEREWDEEEEDESPVLVGGPRRLQESKHIAMSIMTVAAHDGAEEERNSAFASEGKRKGSSGWMKVRGRKGEAPP